MTFIYSPPPSNAAKYVIYKPQGTQTKCRIGGSTSDVKAYDMIRWKDGVNNYWTTSTITSGFNATEVIAMPNGNHSNVFLKPDRKVMIEYSLVLSLYDSQATDYHKIRLTLVPNHNSAESSDLIDDVNYGEVSFDTIWKTLYAAGQNTTYETKQLHAIVENTKSASMAFAFTLRDNAALDRSGGDSSNSTFGYVSPKSYLKVTQLD